MAILPVRRPCVADQLGDGKAKFQGRAAAIPLDPTRFARRNIARCRAASPPFEITADILLRAYSIGLFPMAEDRDADTVLGRAGASAGSFRSTASSSREASPRRCARIVSRCAPTRAFETVDARLRRAREDLDQRRDPAALRRIVRARATPIRSRPTRTANWSAASTASASAAAFFGESMFHRARDASKVALVHLVARLRLGGFRLLDTQFLDAASGEPRRGRDSARRLSAPARRGARRSRRISRLGRPTRPMSGAEALDRALGDGMEVATSVH